MNKSDTLYGNDYKEVSRIKKFADEHHICILLIHHLRKMSDMSDTFNQISGSTGITGAADTMITICKEKRFGDKTILSVTGRDIEGGELFIESDKTSHTWNVIGTKEEIDELENEKMYNINPVVITIKQLLIENNNSIEISSSDLLKKITEYTKIEPKHKTAATLTRYINQTLKFMLLKYDKIFYISPNSNGGSAGRKMYFCKREE